MSHASAPNFAHAAQQAQQWVNELAEDLGWSEHHAHRLMKSVLQTLRDWLTPEETADLSAQLPTLIRGIYFEGWHPEKAPSWERERRDFEAIVADRFGHEIDADITEGVRAVFRLLDRHLSHGELVQVRNSMRKSLRKLWPE